MAPRLSTILLGVVSQCYAIDGLLDSEALVQASVRSHDGAFVSKFIHEENDGPMVYTQEGPIKGVNENGVVIFKNIPYAEPPRRFDVAEPKKSWAPTVRDGTVYGAGCIGSHTGVPEKEDCLSLNIWAPKGGLTDLPVMVYFHGGMLQHGSGQEPLRRGDEIVKSTDHPVIFVNFDFRLGVFGWIWGDQEDGVKPNLGLRDQQLALRWINKNIKAFGGDPGRVTLQGQSEGAGIILVHMVSPGSAGLFHRVIFHSPPADMWSRKANEERTKFMVKRLGCPMKNGLPSAVTLSCLRKFEAQKLWYSDWVSEELSRNMGSPSWLLNAWGMLRFGHNKDLPTYLGWHAVVDNDTMPGEPRELIRQGKWNKCEVLITVSKNESFGIFPGSSDSQVNPAVMMGLNTLMNAKEVPQAIRDYNQTLARSGVIVHQQGALTHMIVTDKMWTCDTRSLASDVAVGGGTAYLGMFWHSPKVDPVGSMTNAICTKGATCHAAEMLYSLPQGRGQGVIGRKHMEEEQKFVEKYSEEIRRFVHGDKVPWVPYDETMQSLTFYDETGHWVVPGYRKEQCEVLDKSMGENLPLFMKRRSGAL
mmetsp:Transcript_54388/g.122331  ORF Transcript_54388/g.122331 Transcript_54388/m.122331 type:complete len:587 (+) Transcript_54388:92-1852(+)